ncbi:MAG TPA: peptidylprolyl isomerase [Oculatellaceae cyanobacterium]
MPVKIINPIQDLTVVNNAADSSINLFNSFDDPLTTGKIAKFELYNTNAANSGITNVVLFDQEGEGAPESVENFINYVEADDYVNSIIHRSIPGFVIQGGGFTVNGLEQALAATPNSGAAAVSSIETNPPVVNEFSSLRSNLRGTLAFAKLGNNPNSATSQWFFNLANNSANLDQQNGGFTVFGQVLSDEDMAAVDDIAALPASNRSNFFNQSAFTNLPLNLNQQNQTLDSDADLVRYKNITVSQVDELNFTVVSNSNPNLVNPTITDGELILDYQPSQSGNAEIVVRATNLLGQTVEDTFTVTVDSTSPIIAIAASDPLAAETGLDPGAFTITRTGDTTNPLTIQYNIAGTATNGSDYAQLANTVEIPAGEDSVILTLTPVDQADTEGNETVTLQLTQTDNYSLGSDTEATVTIVDNETVVDTLVTTNSDNQVSSLVYDATVVADSTNITTNLTDNVQDLGTSAYFANLIGLYEVVDADGGIDTNGDGNADLLPSDLGYARAAIDHRVNNFTILAGGLGDSSLNTTTEEFGDVLLNGGRLYAPFVIANGANLGFDGFIAHENAEQDGTFNDAADFWDDIVAYFAFGAANPDNAIHLQDRGNNVFGFEDLPANLGGSDNDFNDAVFRLAFSV